MADCAERLLKGKPGQKIAVIFFVRERVFLVPLIAKKCRGRVEPRLFHGLIKERINLALVLFVKAHGVGIVDKVAYRTGLATIVKYVCKDIFLLL